MVVSTQAGLLRYDLADRIAVVGRCGEVPLVRFVGKHGRYLNALGEKVSESQISQAMMVASHATGGAPVGFCVRIKMGEVPHYEVALEGGEHPGLLSVLDESLGQSNVEYASKRKSGRLGAPVGIAVASGSFARYRQERALAGAPEGQVKDPILAMDAETWNRVVGA